MATEENQQENQQEEQGGVDVKGTAVKAAAAAAATSVAAVAAKKALSNRGSSNGQSKNGGSGSGSGLGEAGTVFSSVLASTWDAARDALIPAAEDAAGAAGEYLAKNGPDFVSERIIPRFIDSFNEARG
ncbi:MAG: hypothetical protein ACTHNB_11275 [Gaiellaceae bacterium]